jgi:hypothetical protein
MVLFNSLDGAEEADNGTFALGSLVRGVLCGLVAGVPVQREVSAQQRAARADDTSQRQDSRAHRSPAHNNDDAVASRPMASLGRSP